MDHVKKYRWFSSFIISLFLLHFFNLAAFANSSWIWISETRPLDIMPWVAVGTLILETVSLMVFAKIKNGYKTFAVVTIANAVSFAAPYLLVWMFLDDKMEPPFEIYLEHQPFYTVGFLFCLITILIELPIVYCCLKKNAGSRKWFVITILVSNVVTTVLVAIVERIFCVGQW